MVLGKDVLDEPYANENARRIAILKQIGADIRKDTTEVGADNKNIAISGMIIGQAIDTVTTIMDDSPALAERLSEPKGFEFLHTSYGKGRLMMVVEDDTATIKLRLGSYAKKWKISFEKPINAE
jgi:hypothetical protein